MIETVASLNLAVDEKMIIKKNRLQPTELIGNEKRLCVITGIHGDELEGQYVCYELIRKINNELGNLKGIVDIYPSLNPLGMDSLTRGIPMFDLDMNRIFPGTESGSMAENVASKIIKDIEGADMCIDVHSSNIFLREIPQVRITENFSDMLLQYAKLLNIDFIWVQSPQTVLEATLSHNLNIRNTPTLLIEMGVGMRITREYGDQIVDGIFNVMKKMGIWNGEVKEVKTPIISTDGEVGMVNANNLGIFIPCVEHWKGIKQGQPIGSIISPLTGEVEEEVISPCDGMIFTLREHPLVYNGSIIARVLGGLE